jgi:hypothetical protein
VRPCMPSAKPKRGWRSCTGSTTDHRSAFVLHPRKAYNKAWLGLNLAATASSSLGCSCGEHRSIFDSRAVRLSLALYAFVGRSRIKQPVWLPKVLSCGRRLYTSFWSLKYHCDLVFLCLDHLAPSPRADRLEVLGSHLQVAHFALFRLARTSVVFAASFIHHLFSLSRICLCTVRSLCFPFC